MSQYASNLYDPYLIKEYNFKGAMINFYLLIKDSFYIVDRAYETKYNINLGKNKIDVVDVYVFKFILVSSLLTLIYFFKNKNLKLLYILFLILFGSSLITLSFTLRYGLRYEIYIYPLFIFLLSLILNQFKNKNLYLSYVLIILIFSSEFFLLKDKFKNIFNRKNNILYLCKINQAIENDKPFQISMLDSYLSERFDQFDNRFVLKYCNQMKRNLGWKNFKFIIPKFNE